MSIQKVLMWSAMGVALLVPADALAHCDSLDGPVVKAAQKALDARNVAHVLIWVQSNDEAEIRAAFESTLAVRAVNPQAHVLADRYFFETVVRVHRAGEGEPYTGLKPAGREIGPAITAADRALEAGSATSVVKLLTEALHSGVAARFHEVVETGDASVPGDVIGGRTHVKAYVEFIHYVERLYEAITTSANGHSAGHATERAR